MTREIEWKPMRSGDVVVPPEVLPAAFLRWDPARGYMRLAYLLEQEAAGCGVVNAEWDRIADRMIQKARKAGVIRLGAGRKWEWAQ